MRSCVFISVTVLYFYMFSMLAFLSAKKSKLVRDFAAILESMILQTGGSLFMRLTAWPSCQAWFHSSLLGIALVPYTFSYFIRGFCGHSPKSSHRMWLSLVLAVNIYNMTTRHLLETLGITWIDSNAFFVYHITWRMVVIYGICFLAVIHSAAIMWSRGENKSVCSRVVPLLSGILLLFAGNMAVPVFNGSPIDILAGAANAGVMFYTLCSRHVPKTTLLFSRGSYYITAMAINALAFYNTTQTLEQLIRTSAPMLAPFSAMIVATLTMPATMLIYVVAEGFSGELFIKEEVNQTERLSEYTSLVSRSLRLNEILQGLVSVITDALRAKKIHICINDEQGNYPAMFSNNPLNGKGFILNGSSPLVGWLRNHDTRLLLKDFKRTMEYKSIWGEEKGQLENLKIECLFPLKDGDDLAGLMLLGDKDKKSELQSGYMGGNIIFLSSIKSVSSITVRNSKLYKKAYEEARTDEPTGLLSREYFYEALEKTFEKCRQTPLALSIFNMDDFKLCNQLYGNQEGDRTLVHIVRVIQNTMGDNGFCARYSGKEFTMILSGYGIYSVQNLSEDASRQTQNMSRDCVETYPKPLIVSYDIYVIPYGAASLQGLVSNADCVMYHVKRSGKNEVRVYSGGIIGIRDMGKGLVEEHKGMYSEYALTIYAFTAAIDTKDHYTFQYSKNVAYYVVSMGKALGISGEYRGILKESTLLHGIGKIGISKNILNRIGKLTDEEHEVMKHHMEALAEVVRRLPSMDYVIPAAIGYRGRYDGRGYPRRTAGGNVLLAARILCITDSFDAMVPKRNYKFSMSVGFAINGLEKGAGTQSNPELVPTFMELVRTGVIEPMLDEVQEET